MKRRLANIAGVVIVILAIIISYQVGKDKAERRLEGVLGNSLFNVWAGLNNIVENSKEELTIETIEEMNRDLFSVGAYANVIDRTVEHNLLQPVSENLLAIGTNIENRYNQNGGFTENDVEKYKNLTEKVEIINKLLLEIYYISNSEGKVNLEIENFHELENVNNDLSGL